MEISVSATVRERPGMKMMIEDRITKSGSMNIPAAERTMADAPARKAARIGRMGRQCGAFEVKCVIAKRSKEMTAAAMELRELDERRAAKAAPVRGQHSA